MILAQSNPPPPCGKEKRKKKSKRVDAKKGGFLRDEREVLTDSARGPAIKAIKHSY